MSRPQHCLREEKPGYKKYFHGIPKEYPEYSTVLRATANDRKPYFPGLDREGWSQQGEDQVCWRKHVEGSLNMYTHSVSLHILTTPRKAVNPGCVMVEGLGGTTWELWGVPFNPSPAPSVGSTQYIF